MNHLAADMMVFFSKNFPPQHIPGILGGVEMCMVQLNPTQRDWPNTFRFVFVVIINSWVLTIGMNNCQFGTRKNHEL